MVVGITSSYIKLESGFWSFFFSCASYIFLYITDSHNQSLREMYCYQRLSIKESLESKEHVYILGYASVIYFYNVYLDFPLCLLLYW